MEEAQGQPTRVARAELAGDEQDLVVTKMEALQAFRDAQARLTEVNLKLLKAGIRPGLGEHMSW